MCHDKQSCFAVAEHYSDEQEQSIAQVLYHKLKCRLGNQGWNAALSILALAG